jgi:lipopolysaccharide/colanic/teichoic acid biosynthesis glycosyltransferase
MKRTFDLVASLIGLAILLPLFVVSAIVVKITSPGPIFFRQKRVGRNFQPFDVYKFRTMVPGAPKAGPQITVGGDPRITKIGRILRATKLDELPQLLNVISGEMSLVGPRPEVAQYVDMFREDYREILRVRPGITDLASIAYRDEAAVLARAANPEQEYVTRILPEKSALAKEGARRASFTFDLKVLFWTLFSIVAPGASARTVRD